MCQFSVHARHSERIKYIKNTMPDYKLIEMWESDWTKLTTNDTSIINFLKETEIVENLNVRDSLYGGRTQAFKLYHKCTEEEKIRYIDYTSLYPYIQKYGKFPVGHPNVITENFDYSVDKYFGIMKIKILPPRNLIIPALPTRINGKLIFTSCKSCSIQKLKQCDHENEDERAIEGTYVSLEVYTAVNMGYKILKIYEVWDYPERSQHDSVNKSGGLFTDYQNNAMKKKVESSGWPEKVNTESEKKAYIDEFYAVEGIKLEEKNIIKNGGRRQIAKLMANNQWGYLGMNTNKPQFKIINHLDEWLDIINDDKVLVNNISFVNDNLMYVYFTDLEDHHIGGLKTNVVLASFVTAQARIKLFEELNRLGYRVLYCDTDSILYSTKPGEYEPKLGTNLGEFTNEIDPEDGTCIKEFVSAGKKNYGFMTDTGVTHLTVKGFTFNYLTSLKLTFDSIKEVVLDKQGYKIICEQLLFSRNKKLQTIQTGVQQKQYGFVYDTRSLFDNFTTLPFGYKA